MKRMYWNDAIQHGLLCYDTEEKRALADRVRAGSALAREQLALNFLLYCEKLAYKYSQIYKGIYPRIEYEEMAQIGMLAVLESMDQAVHKYDDPFPYIIVSVRRKMALYCRYQSGLIRIPETLDEGGRPIYPPYKMVSIGAFADAEDDEESILFSLLNDNSIKHLQQDYRQLYQAIEKLKGRTKEVICRRYGLLGYTPCSLPIISMIITNGRSKTMAGSYQAQGIKQLRKHYGSI